MNPKPKKKFAVYAGTGCRTCEQGILDIHYQVHPLAPWTDVVFWPYVLGSRWEDFDEAGDIDVCFFIGAIQTDEDVAAAKRLREKSGILVACGACAAFGGMPGLVNLVDNDPDTIKQDPETSDSMPSLPMIESRVSSLSQIVAVDYIVPGCPPTQNLLWAAMQALICGPKSLTRLSYAVNRLPENLVNAVTADVLPPKGSVFAGEKAVCASCSRIKEEKKFAALIRPYAEYEVSGRCLLEQGLLCQGISTREGCGGICTAVGLPCRGCFGKAENVYDPGAKMVSAISSTFKSESVLEIAKVVEAFDDLAGTFYRYTLPTQCALMSKPTKGLR